MNSTPIHLLPALRQYRHNDSPEFLMGYDCTEANKVYKVLQDSIAELEKENIELEECFDECYTELGKVQHELDKQVRSSGDKIAELEAMLASWKRTTHVEMKNMPRITKEQEIEAGL